MFDMLKLPLSRQDTTAKGEEQIEGDRQQPVSSTFQYFLPLKFGLYSKNKTMNNFETRFQRFVAGLAGCRVLDEKIYNLEGGLADYILNHHRVVAELKCLDADMIEKLQQLATEIIAGRDLIVYGEVPFEKLIEEQPDKLELKRKAILKMGGPLEGAFESANSQIKNTKKHLELEDSHGLLVVANTQNQPLEPKTAVWLLSLLFNRRKPNQLPICSSIDCILYLSQIHTLGRLDGVPLQPAITLVRDNRSDYEPLKNYLDEFLQKWAEFNGIPLFVADQPYEQIKDFSVTPMQRRVLKKDQKINLKGRAIAVKFPLPALCSECGARFAHPADRGIQCMSMSRKRTVLLWVLYVRNVIRSPRRALLIWR